MPRNHSTPFVFAVVALVALLAHTTVALAHPKVDEARGLYEEADFEGALARLEEAWEADDLTREDVLSLLRLRALVHLGIGNTEGMREAARAWVLLEPTLELDESTPPEIREAVESARPAASAGVRVAARLEPTDTGVRIGAEVRGDPMGLVRDVRVHARVGDGSWETAEPPMSVTVPPAATVAYAAEAVGPGGATVAHDGTLDDPHIWSATSGGTDHRGGGVPWVWVGVGGGVLAAAGVVAAILLVGGGEQSDLTRPTLPSIE